MRTFQFSDAKSHKFWQIEVSGPSFTVTYGKVGTAGQTQTKSFPTAEKAQAEAEKLIREKTGKGYKETTPTAAVSDAEALERGLIEHRHEYVRWAVYSDYLTEQGDPRGEFMHVQLELENEGMSAADRKRLKKREAELLAEHEKEWLGPLAAFTVDFVPPPDAPSYRIPVKAVHTFERGWLARLGFPSLTVAQARALSACKDARLLRELTVDGTASEAREGQTQQYIDSYYAPGPDVPADIDPYESPALHSLCRCPHLAAVRSFRLGETPETHNGEEYFNCHMRGELAHHLVKQMPFIENLELYAHRVDANKLFALPMPQLKSLVLFHSNSYPLDKLAANKTVTNLTTLRCHPHALDMDGEEDEAGAYIRLKHLRAICRSPHLTALTHLSLRLTDFGDDGIKEIVASGILKRLKVLELRGGCVSDDGAKRLAKCPDLANLTFLNLRANALTDAGLQAIQATKVNADLTHQHTTTEIDFDGGELPEFLFEGDIE